MEPVIVNRFSGYIRHLISEEEKYRIFKIVLEDIVFKEAVDLYPPEDGEKFPGES